MSQIKSLDEYILDPSNEHLTKRRRNPAAYLLLALAGVAMIVLNYTAVDHTQHAALASTLLLFGAIALIWGVAGALFLSGKSKAAVVYRPTGERLRSYKSYYAATEKSTLCQAVESGEVGRIARLRREDGSGLMLQVLATPSGSYALAQVHEYIPHNYRPATGVCAYEATRQPDIVPLVETLKRG